MSRRASMGWRMRTERGRSRRAMRKFRHRLQALRQQHVKKNKAEGMPWSLARLGTMFIMGCHLLSGNKKHLCVHDDARPCATCAAPWPEGDGFCGWLCKHNSCPYCYACSYEAAVVQCPSESA